MLEGGLAQGTAHSKQQAARQPTFLSSDKESEMCQVPGVSQPTPEGISETQDGYEFMHPS